MSEKINLDIDTTEGHRTLEILKDEIEDTEEKLVDMAESVVKQTQDSFNEVMGMMRASYMMLSGVSQVIGGGMSQLFSSIYGVAIATIGTYKAIAAAMVASGVGTAQAIVMFSSLVTALFQLNAIMTGQEELSRRVSGFNTVLHGISAMIGSINFL